ncbi:hypothetical protein HQQ94_05365 [Shewanella sp. VB17]|uniref:hypothetical protein n=1 Tax=Shewanella sp. VB17 TaxID=2739432 RepID=UPI00156509B4|nr:hypothetical protein [Shewanella sp. VB17]NRD72685.1 hypothetical protein [Shewanella sp. VB17]
MLKNSVDQNINNIMDETITDLSQSECGWFIAKALQNMRVITVDGHHHFSAFSLLTSALEGEIRSLFKGHEVVEARVHLFEADDFVINHIDNAYGDATSYICRLDSYGPSRFLINNESVEEKQGHWMAIPAGVEHEVSKGDKPRLSMVVWAKIIAA